MAQQCILIQHFFAAPRATVFRYFADHEQFGRLWRPARCRVLQLAPGSEPRGVGSVREIGVGPIRFDETITAFELDRVIEYRVTRGGPFRNHVGRMRFDDQPGGTQLDYRIEFDSRWPLLGNAVAAMMHQAWLRGVGHAIDRMTGARP